jgi:hypothetical protein
MKKQFIILIPQENSSPEDLMETLDLQEEKLLSIPTVDGVDTEVELSLEKIPLKSIEVPLMPLDG